MYPWVQATHGFGGQYMVGVIYSALGKYGRPATAANRHMCANSMRVRPEALKPFILGALKPSSANCCTRTTSRGCVRKP